MVGDFLLGNLFTMTFNSATILTTGADPGFFMGGGAGVSISFFVSGCRDSLGGRGTL